MLTRRHRLENIKIIETALERLRELHSQYTPEEIAKGRLRMDSVIVHTNEVHQGLLHGWLQAERELLELETKIRRTEKKPKGSRRAAKKGKLRRRVHSPAAS